MLTRLFRSLAGPKHRFTALLRPHIDIMYRMAWRWTRSEADAEDIVQDVLIRLADRVEEMEQIEQLRPWLLKILYRRYIDHYRSQQRSPIKHQSDLADRTGGDHSNTGQDSDPGTLLLDQHPDSRDDIQSLHLRETLQAGLDQLDEDQRMVMLLHDVEGYTAMEAAEILDISPGTVKSRLHRARKKMKIFLEAGTF